MSIRNILRYVHTKYDLHNIIYSWYIIKHALPVTSISPVVSSTTKSTGVVTSTTTLETSVSVVRELVIMLSSAVVSGNDSTTAVVSDGDINELVVVVVDVLVVVILLVDFVLIVVVLLVVVLLFVVLLSVVLVIVLVVDVDDVVVVVVLVEVITGEEVVDLFGTGINTATELSSIIVGFSSVWSLSE